MGWGDKEGRKLPSHGGASFGHNNLVHRKYCIKMLGREIGGRGPTQEQWREFSSFCLFICFVFV